MRFHDPEAAVTVGGEFDTGGRRGFVLLAVTPSPVYLTRAAARDAARALLQFAEAARPAPRKKTA